MKASSILCYSFIFSSSSPGESFHTIVPATRVNYKKIRKAGTALHESLKDASIPASIESSIWEDVAKVFHSDDISKDIEAVKSYTQTVTLLRVGIPSLVLAASANIAYPYVAIYLANLINDSGVFAVVAQDASQYIQNILTTSGLMFSILVEDLLSRINDNKNAKNQQFATLSCKVPASVKRDAIRELRSCTVAGFERIALDINPISAGVRV